MASIRGWYISWGLHPLISFICSYIRGKIRACGCGGWVDKGGRTRGDKSEAGQRFNNTIIFI